MTVGASIGNIIKIAVLGACIYAFVTWEFNGPQENDNSAYAERVCADAIRGRFNTRSVNVYAVSESDKGFVVRAAITLPKGWPAKISCLKTGTGGDEEIRIIEGTAWWGPGAQWL